MSRFVVKFLTRPGCHVCDDARPGVVFEVGRAKGSVEEIDVDSNDLLLRDYGLRIPVVLSAEGQVIAEGLIDLKELREALGNFVS